MELPKPRPVEASIPVTCANRRFDIPSSFHTFRMARGDERRNLADVAQAATWIVAIARDGIAEP